MEQAPRPTQPTVFEQFLYRGPDCLNLLNVEGFIINFPSHPQFGPLTIPFWKGRHWIAVREVNNVFYNLDSKLPASERIGNEKDLLMFLAGNLKEE